MYVCVCLSVCLSARISPEQHTQSLPKFFVHVAYGHGSFLEVNLALMGLRLRKYIELRGN